MGKYFNMDDTVNIDNIVNINNSYLSSSKAVFDNFKNWNEIEGLIREIDDEGFREKCEKVVREIRKIKRFKSNVPNSVEFMNDALYYEVRFSWSEFKIEGVKSMREDIEIGICDSGIGICDSGEKVWVERKVGNAGIEISEIGKYVGMGSEKNGIVGN